MLPRRCLDGPHIHGQGLGSGSCLPLLIPFYLNAASLFMTDGAVSGRGLNPLQQSLFP